MIFHTPYSGGFRVRHVLIIFLITLLLLCGIILFDASRPQKDRFLTAVTSRAESSFDIGILPSNIRTTSLDSTIRIEWTRVNDDRVASQLLTVKDMNGRLLGSKLVGAGADVADMNGLETDKQYKVGIQLYSKTGALSQPVEITATTKRQLPMSNAVFFDNFNFVSSHHSQRHGLNPDLYDVRMWSDYGDTQHIQDAFMVMPAERHYHTQLLESHGSGGVIIRPRQLVTLGNEPVTFQFETDIPAVQDAHGKWLIVAFSDRILDHSRMFEFGRGDSTFNFIDFSFFGSKNGYGKDGTNFPRINEMRNGKEVEVLGSKGIITPPNVRVPVTIKLSRTYAAIYVNGELVVEKKDVNLPFSQGYWYIGQINYRSAFIDNYAGLDRPTVTNQLIHWDVINFNSSEQREFIPTIRTYIPPGCTGTIWMAPRVQEYKNCHPQIDRPSGKQTYDYSFTVTDDVTRIVRARAYINGPNRVAPVNILLNGTKIGEFPIEGGQWDNLRYVDIADISAFRSLMKPGQNTVRLQTPVYNSNADYSGMSHFQLEVEYNSPRIFEEVPPASTPRMSATVMDFRFDKKFFPSSNPTGTTFVYSSGTTEPINYTITTPNKSPWLKIKTPLTGTARSIADGGVAIPIEFEVDFAEFSRTFDRKNTDQNMGHPGIIRVDGVTQAGKQIEMPVMIAVLAVDVEDPGRPTRFYPWSEYTPNTKTYVLSAVPQGDPKYAQYFKVNNTPISLAPTFTPGPTALPTQPGQPTATSTPRPTSTPVPSATRIPSVTIPSATSVPTTTRMPTPTSRPVPSSTPAVTVVPASPTPVASGLSVTTRAARSGRNVQVRASVTSKERIQALVEVKTYNQNGTLLNSYIHPVRIVPANRTIHFNHRFVSSVNPSNTRSEVTVYTPFQ